MEEYILIETCGSFYEAKHIADILNDRGVSSARAKNTPKLSSGPGIKAVVEIKKTEAETAYKILEMITAKKI